METTQVIEINWVIESEYVFPDSYGLGFEWKNRIYYPDAFCVADRIQINPESMPFRHKCSSHGAGSNVMNAFSCYDNKHQLWQQWHFLGWIGSL